MKKPDIYYPLVKAADDNIELRYSLRSLENIKGGYGKVFVVGYKPHWLQGVEHIPFDDGRTSGRKALFNTTKKELIVCRESEAEDIVIMMDDVYILRPMEIGFYIREEGIDKVILKAVNKKRPPYVINALKNTKELFPGGVTAYVHVPHRINREKALKLHSKYDMTKGKWYLMADVYVNEYRNDHTWEYQSDFKAYNNPRRIIEARGRDFFSTGDAIATHKNFKKEMDKLFPFKSKFEKL